MDKGNITYDDILRKYMQELHANEIVLLSYYIAAINIEAVFDEVNGPGRGYKPFEGIVLTDTFESTERQDALDDDMFGTNNERLKKQQEVPITAIITNPPYSIGQKSVNNDNANVKYPNLISRINDTYAKYSNASLKKSLKDTYIEAIRWASDRIEDRGVIGFISNAGFIDSKSTDGLRHCLYKEFNYIYIFNLHGDQLHTNGEESKKEGGKIFGSGSRTPTAITILVKDGSDNHKLYYKDIKSYLSRSEKLETIRETTSIQNIQWKEIIPDKQNNWINQIDNDYMNFSALFAKNTTAIMKKQFTGVNVSRDNWLVGFNKKKVETNAKTLILNYNSEIKRLKNVADPKKRLELRNTSEKFIKWSAKLNNMFKKGQSLGLTGKVVPIMQRPFTKKWLYWDNDLNERPSKYRDIYKYMGKILYMQGAGSKKDFSALITDQLPSLQLNYNGKGFPEYISKDNFGKITNINSKWLNKNKFNIDDGLAYVYAMLNSKEYRRKYHNDLLKDYPHVPIVKDKDKYVEIGKKLISLHLNYEQVPVYSNVRVLKNYNDFAVEKMNFGEKANSKEKDKTTIIFNKYISIKNIPM